MPTTGHAVSIALLLAVSSMFFQTSRAERAAETTSMPANISADVIRGYIKWIVDQTGWPSADVPPIKTFSSDELNKMLLGPSSELEAIQPRALYSKKQHLIFLASTWKEDDVLDQSILVHELVHHLQMENNIQLECWGRYEAQAYELQIRWLRTQGIGIHISCCMQRGPLSTVLQSALVQSMNEPCTLRLHQIEKRRLT
jgi:hypothetical protein